MVIVKPHALFSIAVSNESLRNKYQEMANKHNISVLSQKYPDAGIDLYVPKDYTFNVPNKTTMIDMEIIGVMHTYNVDTDEYTPTGYYMFPRSSISKTPLMLANHTGIIDSGYRGNLLGGFRWLKYDDEESYCVKGGTRLLQVCHPGLLPIIVEIANPSDLDTTDRGTGGFGSTGI